MTPRKVKPHATAKPKTAPNKQTGNKAGPGRPKGSLNKVTQSVKAALEEAFERRGGVDALMRWANEEPSDFYSLWGKLLPKNLEVGGMGGGPIVVTFRHEGK